MSVPNKVANNCQNVLKCAVQVVLSPQTNPRARMIKVVMLRVQTGADSRAALSLKRGSTSVYRPRSFGSCQCGRLEDIKKKTATDDAQAALAQRRRGFPRYGVTKGITVRKK